MGDSTFVNHSECPSCGSKDALANYSDGGQHCFSAGCNYHVNGNGMKQEEPVKPSGGVSMDGIVAAITNRKISQETCKKYKVVVSYDHTGNIEKHYYPYYHVETGELVASKVRTCTTKQFITTGNPKGSGLFGQNVCRGTGKFLTITEGELDAMSVSEMFGNKYDVVSLRGGAQSAAKELKEQLEWLEGYDQIVLCFDNDQAGQVALEQVKDIFSPNKMKICKLPLKDASEMLVANRVQEFVQHWWDSKTYRPDGIVAGEETWDALVNKRAVKSVLYPWDGLNELTKGHRSHEMVTITSGSGMGKSQMIRELEFDLLQRTDANIGVLALEEDIARTALGIMSVCASKPLHLDEDASIEELRPFWEKTLGTGRYYLFDHFGSTSTDNLLGRVRYMAKALDCRYIILDHLSIVVSAQENGDERKAIDEICTKLRQLVQETGITLFLVSHLRRTQGKAHELGGMVSLQDLRGSQSIAQLSDMVIGLERDQQHEDPVIRNTTCVRVLKNRYSGMTGPSAWLRYDNETGRMTEVPPPEKDDHGEREF